MPYSFRALSLNPRRARPPATMSATQLTDFGTDQSPMMTGHSSKIRTKWSNATRAQISPATSENVFAPMSDPPQQISSAALSTAQPDARKREQFDVFGFVRHRARSSNVLRAWRDQRQFGVPDP